MINNYQKLLKELGICIPVEEISASTWDFISRQKYLSEDFIREYQDKIKWQWIGYFVELSEDFIREFQDKLNWHDITLTKKLSDDFLFEFQNKIVWNLRFNSHDVSFPIMKKFILKTEHTHIDEFRTNYLTKSQKKEIERILSLKSIFKFQKTV